MRRVAALIALFCVGFAMAPGQAQTVKIEIRDAWARLPSEGGKTTTVYFEAVNLTDADDRLLGASSAWAERIVIQHFVPKGYNMVAQVVPSVRVKARRAVKLTASEYHLKLTGLTQPLKPGIKIPIDLRFEKAGKVEVEAEVTNQVLGNMDK